MVGGHVSKMVIYSSVSLQERHQRFKFVSVSSYLTFVIVWDFHWSTLEATWQTLKMAKKNRHSAIIRQLNTNLFHLTAAMSKYRYRNPLKLFQTQCSFALLQCRLPNFFSSHKRCVLMAEPRLCPRVTNPDVFGCWCCNLSEHCQCRRQLWDR